MLLKQTSYIINQVVKRLIISVNIICLLFFKDTLEGYLSLKDADDEQSKFANELKNVDKDVKSVEKKFFLKNIGTRIGTRTQTRT